MKRYLEILWPWLLRTLGFGVLLLPICLQMTKIIQGTVSGVVSIFGRSIDTFNSFMTNVNHAFGDALANVLQGVQSNPWFQLGCYITSLDVFLRYFASLLSLVSAFLFWLAYGVFATIIAVAISYLAFRVIRYVGSLFSKFGNPDNFS